MKLHEMMVSEAVSLDAAISQLVSVAASLASHTNENKVVFKHAASNAENNQTQVLRRANKKKTKERAASAGAKSQIALRNNRWFTEHFKSSKRSMGGLQTALEAIINSSGLPGGVKNKAKAIAGIKTSAYNAQGRANSGSEASSGTQAYNELLELLPGLLDALASSQGESVQKSLSSKAAAIRKASQEFDAVETSSKQSEQDFKDGQKKDEKRKTDNKQAGQHASSANDMATKLINELVPKDKRAAVKSAVDRSDNKLQALKQELDKLGIKESVRMILAMLVE